jgi:hypothetical protein
MRPNLTAVKFFWTSDEKSVVAGIGLYKLLTDEHYFEGGRPVANALVLAVKTTSRT